MKFIKSRRKAEPKAGWISVEDALPKESGEYLCATDYGFVKLLSYSAYHQLFNCQDYFDRERAEDLAITSVRFWMYVPDPPEELR